MIDLERLTERIAKKEGFRLKLYKDTVGKLTIGYGRNIEDNGIRRDEAELMLKNDVVDARYDAARLPWFYTLDKVRQACVIEMIFNMGLPRFQTFAKMISALVRSDYDEAAREALDSKWARQVGARAEEIAEMFRTGEWL